MIYNNDDEELMGYIKMGYSFSISLLNTDGELYRMYTLYFKDKIILTWNTDIGIQIDMKSVIKKYITENRNKKLNELGI